MPVMFASVCNVGARAKYMFPLHAGLYYKLPHGIRTETNESVKLVLPDSSSELQSKQTFIDCKAIYQSTHGVFSIEVQVIHAIQSSDV